ncbi:hypothetical protein NP233_g7953 [Leucocoprinus birnbaumii]|uniref:Uncharacterized protein n=1 Tax=Leucocoprinus birnbaumii TaxID=56174 RepID=A0AAD5VN81_9AGAR|nr:hypothetical protein NP233_g7953 [Leucocoprinus birnbaumii]
MDTLSAVQGDTHPLLLLLSDLKSSLVNFQNEAHASAVKLQHHSLSASRALERAHALEHENSVLNNELHVLRSNPQTSSSLSKESADRNQESTSQLTLSLRTLNEKLTATETILAQRTAELSLTLAELQKSKLSVETAHDLSARIRGREEALKSRERELELKVQLAEERARMSERAIEEYAALVRNLEGRAGGGQSNGHAIHSTDHGDVQRHLHDFARERESLQIQLSSAQHDLAILASQHTALTKSSEYTLSELSELRTKLQLLERDDTTATKMVSRYMTFSQNQTNQLQHSLATLSNRHSATLSSLTSQIQTLTRTLSLAQSHNGQLLSALDSLGNEVMKEGYGRRREVRLRIKLVGREERVLEGLRRWLRRAEEGYRRIDGSSDGARGGVESKALAEMIQDAKILIDNLDNPLPIPASQDEGSHVPLATSPVSGSLARLIAIQSTLDDLVEDLQREQAKRLALEKMVIRQEVEGIAEELPPSESAKLARNGHAQETHGTSNLKPLYQTISPLLLTEEANPANISPPTAPGSGGTGSPTPTHIVEASATPSGRLPTAPQPPTPTIEITPPPAVEGPPSIPVTATDLMPDRSGTNEQAASPTNIVEVPLKEGDGEGEVVRDAQPDNAVTDGLVEAVDASGYNRDDSPVDGPEVEADPAKEEEVNDVPPLVDGVQEVDASGGQEPVAQDDTVEEQATGTAEQGQSLTSIDERMNIKAEESDSAVLDTSQTLKDGAAPVIVAEAGTIYAAPIPENFHATTTPSPAPIAQPQPRIRPPAIPALSISLPPPSSPNPPPSLTLETIAIAPETQAAPIIAQPPSLIQELVKARTRYDHISRAFHACHIALEGLKASLPSATSTTSSHAYSRYSTMNNEVAQSTIIPNDVLSAIVQRLDDYTEDARVELEIRIADEEVMGGGYEALLMLPGALVPSALGASSPSSSELMANGDSVTEATVADVEAQIRAFVDGTDPVISRALSSFERKLENIEHDIVTVKKAMHEPHTILSPPESTPSPAPSSTPLSSSTDVPDSTTSGGGGWTSWIRTPISRPTTPTPAALAPTFGSLMTSRRPSSSALRRTTSALGLSSSSHDNTDIIKSLGFKVPMPNLNFAFPSSAAPAPHYNSKQDDQEPHTSVASPSFGGLGLGHAFSQGPRTRTISTSMYMLGMGVGGSGGDAGGPGVRSANTPAGSPSQRRAVSAAVVGSSVGNNQRKEGEDDVD